MQRWVLILGLIAAIFFGLRWKQKKTELARLSQTTQSVELPAPAIGIDIDALQRDIVKDGEVDDRALDKISGDGDAIRTAVANYIAARFEYEHKRPELSLRYVERAELFGPRQSGIRLLHAALLLESNHYPESIAQGEQAVRLDPKSSEAARILGWAYYYNQQLPSAIEQWQHSLALHPNDKLQEQLEKAQREVKVEGGFLETHEGRFVLRYDNGTISDPLKAELFNTLESQYDDIAQDLGDPNHTPVTITLYTREQFLEVTHAPEWAGALNDGQLRIPITDTTTLSRQMRISLRHELTHWFVHEIAHECPVWLNEGVAQMEEPRTLSSLSPQVRKLLETSTLPTLTELEKPFIDMPADQAQVAYAESLAAVEYLRINYGKEGVRRILEALGEGKPINDALNSATGFGYSELQQNFDTVLRNQRAAVAGHE
jgi:hypothetical protein